MISRTGLDWLDRRRFLGSLSSGAGAIALAWMLENEHRAAARAAGAPFDPLAPRPPHFPARAKRVIHMFCVGAVSHLDTWDYKPKLIELNGKPLPPSYGGKVVTFQGENGNLAQSPWSFRPRGECGKYVSDLLPRLGDLVDDMCFIHSMTSRTNTHGPGEIYMSTGFTREGAPSMGAWVSYALGTENHDLPAFVAIPDPRGVPQQGPVNWSNGFLPAFAQGTAWGADRPIEHIARPSAIDASSDRRAAAFLRELNQAHLEQSPEDSDLAARIAAYELAGRMQTSAPEAGDLGSESPATRALYGVDDVNPIKAGFARNCLFARRLIERGVRFVTLYNGAFAMGEGFQNWDGHQRIKSDYERHGPVLDQPAAALLVDLKARGLLDDTLLLWTTEFGRMPTFQKGAQGRDHNPKGFTAWMAGAGVKRGTSVGATDELGLQAVENVVDVHDFHATVLHLLGLDHTKLTYRHNGADRRLTDVAGKVVTGVLA